MKTLLLWYVDWRQEGKSYLAELSIETDEDIKTLLNSWQQARLDQDITLIEAYTVTERHSLYGKHTDIDEVRTKPIIAL